jgi:hypothetical protein
LYSQTYTPSLQQWIIILGNAKTIKKKKKKKKKKIKKKKKLKTEKKKEKEKERDQLSNRKLKIYGRAV